MSSDTQANRTRDRLAALTDESAAGKRMDGAHGTTTIASMPRRCRSFLLVLVMFSSWGFAQDDTLIDPFGDYTLKLPFTKTIRVGKGVSTEQSLIENWSDPISGVMVKFMVALTDTGGLTEEGLIGANFQTALQELGYRQVDFALTESQRKRVGSARLLTGELGTSAVIVKFTAKGMITIHLTGRKIEAVKQTLTWIYANNQ